MSGQHTPGPWVALDIGEVVTENLEVCIATINGSDTSTVEEDEANARLIAAAPDLLEALESILENAVEDDFGNQLVRHVDFTALDALVAKARGQS